MNVYLTALSLAQTIPYVIDFRGNIPVVMYKLNTKYVTGSQNTTKFIALFCTICFITTCFGPFLGHLQVVYV